MTEVLKQMPKARRGQNQARKAVTVRLPMEEMARVRAQAERLGITETEAVARLVLTGLDQVEGAYDPNAQFDSLGYTLAAIADRLDQLDRAVSVTARAAVKGTMISRRGLLAGADEERVRAIDAQLNEAVDSLLSEHGISL